MTLTKDHLINSIAKENGFQKKRSIEVVETLLEILKSRLSSGEDVLVSGFGKFCVKEKHERKGRNPATGEDMKLVARRVVTFKCSRRLRDKINGYQQGLKFGFDRRRRGYEKKLSNSDNR